MLEFGNEPPAGPLPARLAVLTSIVSSAFGVRAAALHGTRRGPATVAFARQVAVYLACTRFGISYTTAGAAFGRDRTTVAHACRVVEERRDDPRIDSILDYLERAVGLTGKRPRREARHGSVN